MAKNDPEKELFPFALSPSAAPPASGVHHAQVRVPPPSQGRIELPLSSHASRPDYDEIEIEESGELEIAIDLPPPSRPSTVLPPPHAVPVPRTKLQVPTVRIHDAHRARRGPHAIIVAAGAAMVAVGLAGIGAAVLLRTSAPEPRTAAFVDDPVASAVPPPAPAPPSSAAPAPKPFDRDAARAALDALAPKLESCKLPRGKPVRAKITFAPTGEATAVQVLAPASGKPAACVASRLHDASVDAFDGPAASYVHTFAR